SLAHQGAKEVPEKRGELIQWLEEMEYDENKLPRPDLVIYLHVVTSISRELVKKKAIVREYRHDLDIAERHKDHLEKAEEVFLKLSDEKGWKKIECMKDGTLRSIEDIHTELLQIVEEIHL
ncbi:MAG TPA: thymidylate kinase, partial [Patescibacteria group bacterium]|nr:thymidylate kinase [Patescibacteria group bacterium]